MKRSSSYRTLLVLFMSAAAGWLLWGCAKLPVKPKIPATAVEDRQYAEAEALYKSGDYDRAFLQYQAYVAQYPNRPPAPDALMKMASICIVSEKYPEARELYQRVLSDYPDSTSAENARVEILATYYDQGDYSSFFERLSSVNVDTLAQSVKLRLYKLMGDAYLSSGQAKAAVDAYARSISCYPQGQRPEMIPEMKTAISVLDTHEIEELLSGPEYLPKAYLLYQLGLSSMKAGWDQSALDAFGKFLERYPDHELAGEVRGYIDAIKQKASSDRFAVGCLLPLTGPYSSYGKKALNGVELALYRFRLNHPEVPLKLVVKDTGSSEAQAIQAVRELDAAHVAAILGPIAMAKTAAEEAQNIGIPIITLSQKEGITDIGEYVFRNFLTPQTQVRTIVSYLTGKLGLKRFAILYPDEKYGTTFMNLFWDEVIAHGGVVTGCESYQGAATDFADPIKKLVGLYYELPDELKAELANAERPLPAEVWKLLHPKVFQDHYADDRPWLDPQTPGAQIQGGQAGVNIFMLGDASEGLLTGEGDYNEQEDTEPKADVDFDALFIPDSPNKVGLIVPQLAYYDVDNVVFTGTNLWHSDELIQMARRYLQNSLLTDGFFAESSLPIVREFVDSYKSVYGEAPGFIEAIAYDTAGILFETVSRPDVVLRSDIREKLVSQPPYQGVTGPTSFLETGEAEKEPFLLRIKGGRFRAVTGGTN